MERAGATLMKDANDLLNEHIAMYQLLITKSEKRIEALDTRGAEGKKRRLAERERIQTSWDKLDALRWFGRDAGFIEKRY